MENLLVTLAERKWIAENAVREMGKNILVKVIDLDKYIKHMETLRSKNNLSPYVEIMPVSEDMHKIPNRMATYQKDPVTGVYYGIPIDQDEFGNIKWQKIQLQDNLSLNLDRVSDQKIWAVIRFYPEIKGSPWQVQNPYYKVFDPVTEAMKESAEIESMRKAFERVEMITGKPKEMVMFARFLGEEFMENSNYQIVTAALFRWAKNSPVEFNRKWESRNRGLYECFNTACALGIIINDINQGYKFQNIMLGVSPEDVIKMMSKDPNIVGSISSSINEKDTVIKIVTRDIKEREEEKKKALAPGDDSGDTKTGPVNDFD